MPSARRHDVTWPVTSSPHARRTSATQAVVDAIDATAFGPVIGFENLSIIPLLAPGEREPGYLTLDDALAQGWVRFEEVGGKGSVPEIVVVTEA